jgi:hypothetical protein
VAAPSTTIAAEWVTDMWGIYWMSRYRSTHDTEPPQLVIGFGNTGPRAIHAGVSAIAYLLGRDG